ncbi:MAG: hypothetical protein WCC64_10740, partial [Aliidongia sp.]
MSRPERDWAPIDEAYRTDPANVREIARRFDVPETSLRTRAKKLGMVRDHPVRKRAASTPGQAGKTERPDLHRRLSALIKLYDKLRRGLERVIDGKAKEHEDRLLSKAGGAIDAFNALAGAQAKLIHLERLAFDGAGDGTVPDLAERLRAAQRAMAGLSSGAADSPGAEAVPTEMDQS